MIATETAWVRVTRRRPCPICGRATWCGISADGTVVRCMRVPSSRESPGKDGTTGWIHRIGDRPVALPPKHHRPAPVPRIDAEALWGRYDAETQPGDIRRLSGVLSVSSASLRRIGFVWAAEHRAWACPMFDVDMRIIGLHLRNERGEKWAVRGSHNGLFVPDGGLREQATLIYVAEGATDVAAALDLRVCAIGRSSCRGQVEWLVELLSRRDVVICADRDEPKKRPDGTTFRPGQEGAQHLAGALWGKARTIKIIAPPGVKDMRRWLDTGATPDVLRAVTDNALYWRPSRGR